LIFRRRIPDVFRQQDAGARRVVSQKHHRRAAVPPGAHSEPGKAPYTSKSSSRRRGAQDTSHAGAQYSTSHRNSFGRDCCPHRPWGGGRGRGTHRSLPRPATARRCRFAQMPTTTDGAGWSSAVGGQDPVSIKPARQGPDRGLSQPALVSHGTTRNARDAAARELQRGTGRGDKYGLICDAACWLARGATSMSCRRRDPALANVIRRFLRDKAGASSAATSAEAGGARAVESGHTFAPRGSNPPRLQGVAMARKSARACRWRRPCRANAGSSGRGTSGCGGWWRDGLHTRIAR